jgi:uncharacterized protein (TIGR02300 family)
LAKASLGTKRICPSCHQPFYDLTKSPAHCPNCSHEFDPTEILRSRTKTRGPEEVKKVEEVKAPPPKDAEPPEAGDVPETEEGEEEEDEELLEDASDLGGDEDAVSEVIENVDEGGEER